MNLIDLFNLRFKKYYYLFFVITSSILIVFQFIITFWINLKGDVYFNEDIARDLLLLEDVVSGHPITLIGPKLSIAGGLYHGPLWIYLNLPAYLLGGGNPIIMGIFWMGLYVVLLGITFFVAQKLFDKTVALLSVLLLTSASYLFIFNNAYSAILIYPVSFYFLTKYIKNLKVKDLLISLLLLGFCVQSEIAFGAPVLIVTVLFLIYQMFKQHKIHHLLSLGILIIPFSTYILFDLRHGFIQAQSFIHYLISPKTEVNLPLSTVIPLHFTAVLHGSLQSITHSFQVLTFIVLVLFGYVLLHSKKIKGIQYPFIYKLFGIIYGGYWVVTIIYRGDMWAWYYNQFTPVIVIIFCSFYRYINKKLFITLFIVFYGVGLYSHISEFLVLKNSFIGQSIYSWQVYKSMAQKVYQDSSSNFGYYINEHDLLGYRTRFAFHQVGKSYSYTGEENVKKETTYLIMDNNLDNKWWKKVKVRIEKNPDQTLRNNNLYTIEEYKLTSSEAAVPSDPNLVNSLFFR